MLSNVQILKNILLFVTKSPHSFLHLFLKVQKKVEGTTRVEQME